MSCALCGRLITPDGLRWCPTITNDRHAIGPGLEERHRRVEQADGAVNDDQHRLAGGLGVAVRHGDGRFLVQAGEQLGRGVLAVVDERFVQALERRAGIDGGVLEADLLEHVHHEVGGRPPLRRGACRRAGRSPGRACAYARSCACASVGSATGGGAGGATAVGRVFCRDDQTGGAERRAFEEVPAVERISHGALLVEGSIIRAGPA